MPNATEIRPTGHTRDALNSWFRSVDELLDEMAQPADTRSVKADTDAA